jgi:hypothetical protein
MVICSTPALVVWNYISERSAFSALSAANILLVEKVETYEAVVAWATIDNTLQNAIVLSEQARQFDIDTRNRKANMANWQANSAETRDESIKIHAALDSFRTESREQRVIQAARLEELSQQILSAVASTNHNTAITRAYANDAAHKLSQKVITAPDVEALKKRADQLQKQNKELRKKKAKPIFKLFLDQPTTQ